MNIKLKANKLVVKAVNAGSHKPVYFSQMYHNLGCLNTVMVMSNPLRCADITGFLFCFGEPLHQVSVNPNVYQNRI
jgi:hypothetical protein